MQWRCSCFFAAVLLASGQMGLLTGLGVFALNGLWFWFFHKPASAYDLGAGAMFCWAVLMMYTAIAIPGASYLLTCLWQL